MRIRLNAAAVSRSYDTRLGRFTDDEAIPCFRCGVCCRRWQPLIAHVEADRLAAHLQMPTEEFLRTHARPYPFAEETYQLNERDGGCTFLAVAGGRSLCTVHPARPQACRDWDASFGRKECLDGLQAISPTGQGLALLTLYDSDQDLADLVAHLRSASGFPGAQ
jgi:Fe-S-cluster containining protein